MSEASQIQIRLVIIEGKDNRDKGKVIPMTKSPLIIGRGQADIVLTDLQVSRAHVALELNSATGELSFTDLGSTNGTLLNGELRKNGILRDRDRLKVGNTVFDCQLGYENQTLAINPTGQKEKMGEASSLSLSMNGPSRFHSNGLSLSQIEKSGVENAPVSQNKLTLSEIEKETPEKEKGTRRASPQNKPITTTTSPQSPSSLAQKPFALLFPLLSLLKKFGPIYLSMPKRARIALATLLITFLLVSQISNLPDRKPSNRDLPTYLTEINNLLSSRKLDQAKQTAIQAAKDFPESSIPLVLLGNTYFEQRKIDLAIDAYLHSLPLRPLQLITYTRLIRLYMISNKKAEAKRILNEYLPLLDSSEANKKLHIQTGELFLEYPDLETDKNALLNRAKSLQTKWAPDDSIGYKIEAYLLSSDEKASDHLQHTEELLKKGLELSPHDDWIFDRLFYLKLNQPTDAKSTLDTWIQVNPRSTKPLLLMSYLKFNEKNFIDAIPYLQKIMTLLANEPNHPHYSEALNLMGQISLQQNQLAEAENFLRQSCQLGYKPSCSHPLLVNSVKQ